MTDILSFIGMAAGAVTFVLGLAQLTCEHARSGWIPRASTICLSSLAAWTAIDSWDALAGLRPPQDPKTVAFIVVLALSWAHRRIYGLITAHRSSGATQA